MCCIYCYGADDNAPTYCFHEIIERLRRCDTLDDINLYGDLINDEKKRYSLFDLKIIHAAFHIARELKIKYGS